MTIEIQKATQLKEKPDASTLTFGKVFTDHMLVMEHDENGWHDAKIVPYGPFAMEPSSMVIHYGQTVFEGMKAYRTPDGRINLFRPEENFKRLNLSCERLCIPQLDEKYLLEGLLELIRLEQDWIPTAPDTSLYIRPFVFANDPFIGVKASTRYIYCVILSPVGPYYAEGLKPVKIYVEDEYVRAVKGGMGFAKTAGNYAASLLAGEAAHAKGYSQVLWLDGIEHKNVEEVGAMNIFFKFNDELVTPALNGSILGGITRKSIIELARSMGVTVNERTISIEEVFERNAKGELEEVFGSGTAAVVRPVGELNKNGDIITINNGEMGPLTSKLYDTLTGIQWGRVEDTFGWTMEVK
ncbi:MAG: branched-chain amino acid aminotransferase [Firmicutes bacterium]|nr:branched-chain amino acid aminotransferase [Bacillota bacterium]